MYDVIMLSREWKKEILIELGFGTVSVKEVESWFRNKYPMDYKTLKINLKWIKQQIKDGNEMFKEFEKSVIRITAENMTRQERDKLLDFAEVNKEKLGEMIEQETVDIMKFF